MHLIHASGIGDVVAEIILVLYKYNLNMQMKTAHVAVLMLGLTSCLHSAHGSALDQCYGLAGYDSGAIAEQISQGIEWPTNLRITERTCGSYPPLQWSRMETQEYSWSQWSATRGYGSNKVVNALTLEFKNWPSSAEIQQAVDLHSQNQQVVNLLPELQQLVNMLPQLQQAVNLNSQLVQALSDANTALNTCSQQSCSDAISGFCTASDTNALRNAYTSLASPCP